MSCLPPGCLRWWPRGEREHQRRVCDVSDGRSARLLQDGGRHRPAAETQSAHGKRRYAAAYTAGETVSYPRLVTPTRPAAHCLSRSELPSPCHPHTPFIHRPPVALCLSHSQLPAPCHPHSNINDFWHIPLYQSIQLRQNREKLHIISRSSWTFIDRHTK